MKLIVIHSIWWDSSFNLMRTRLSWFVLLLLLLLPVRVFAAPTAEDIIALLALKQDQLADLERGKIITFRSGETSKNELAIGLGMYLPSPPTKFVAYFKHSNLAQIDPDIIVRGDLQLDANGANTSKKLAFAFKEKSEAEGLLNVEAASQFNLSAEEIQHFLSLKKKLTNADKASLLANISQHYRQILLQRWQAYRNGGLAGIAPYVRDGSNANPAAELRAAAVSIKGVARFFPELYQAWVNYPAKLPSDTEETFSWLNRKIEDRATAILSHRILQTSDTSSVIFARHFFVGHSYNSSQLIVGCLPYRDGSILFYENRTYTDQISGIGSSLKQSIGRKLMKTEMTKNLERLRSNIQSF